MSRKIKDSKLDDRTARSKLDARGKPHYRLIEPGLHLGYRKPRGRRGNTSGRWVVRKYVGDQSYVVETIGIADDFSNANGESILDFKQAQDKARKFMPGGAGGPFTVRDALNAYFEMIEDEGRSARDGRLRIEPHIHLLADTSCDRLTSEALRKWLDAIARAPARVRTSKGKKQQHRAIKSGDAEAVRRRRVSANRTWAVLRAALNFGFESKKIASPAEWERVKPFKNVTAAKVLFLLHGEAQRLINASDAEFRPMVEAALATGCRYGELARVEAQDFDPDNGTIAVRQSKSGKPRHVVLAKAGVDLFRRLSAGRSGADLILRRNDGSPWDRSNQQKPMALACERAKIEPAISFHILRHTWASLSIKAGMPMWIVAKNLGHADTKMVQKHYGHVEEDFVSKAIRDLAPQFDTEPSNVTAIG